ncbi:Six-hairpin glycosidase [Fusarium albosuccineum]|uniref:Six-hairpin glycosidase n=1 Tax=Fusarium albosuccineum TaxID=1237068 RepID=A0A8H4KB91_9HYPO|nr:Six-hairpin glycosidase [Fusarium albosuccineum]
MSLEFDRSWMWHPTITEARTDTAGAFVHFRRSLVVQSEPPKSLKVQITADTRYKLYINNRQVAFGPVKGDSSVWFYDEVDIAPFLHLGQNHVAVHVLRFFHSTTYAPSFPRLPFGGLWVSVWEADKAWASQLDSSAAWETAIDPFTILRIDEPEDHFLHIYERSLAHQSGALFWTPAKVLEFKSSTGNSPPWHLSPRLIPPHRIEKAQLCAVHNVKSPLSPGLWRDHLVGDGSSDQQSGLLLAKETHHSIELEAPHHMTAFLRVCFQRSRKSGGTLRITYAESYEDEPESTPWVRRKGDRCDYSKQLFGPQDIYEFKGKELLTPLGYYDNEDAHEVFMPFHFRTFRFLRLDIDVGRSDLVLEKFEIETVNYALDVTAALSLSTNHLDLDKKWNQLWSTSIRTLANCMHDCYEDCPFYEQLQYAMDTRSSSLFTYIASGDDRLARQAIIQLHNSFQARIGLTASRAPTHRPQLIPHFSLYWICMIHDHFTYYGDKNFIARFLPVVDAVLSYFDGLVEHHGLVARDTRPGIWDFVDWTHQWKPHGIPPAIHRTGISTFTNQLYAYTLCRAANLAEVMRRPAIAGEYQSRTDSIVCSLKDRCFDGTFFSDTISSNAVPTDYSQHCQVWAVLSGCLAGVEAQQLLRRSLQGVADGTLVQESISMSFYTMRALSLAGGDIYDETFHHFWDPWHLQLSRNVTTWVEDSVSQRSDCHAWGSIPIYEFMAEVIGIRPLEPGWSAIEFRPRLGLFPKVNASVPLNMVDGKVKGFVYVSWTTTETGDTEVGLKLEMAHPAASRVALVLPKHRVLSEDGGEWRLLVYSDDILRRH